MDIRRGRRRAGVQVNLAELHRVCAGFLTREAGSRRGRCGRRAAGWGLVQDDRHHAAVADDEQDRPDHHAERPDQPAAPGAAPAGARSRSLAGTSPLGTSLLGSGPRIVARTVQVWLRTAINGRPANHRTSAPLLRTHCYDVQCSPCPLAPFCAITCCSGSPLTQLTSLPSPAIGTRPGAHQPEDP